MGSEKTKDVYAKLNMSLPEYFDEPEYCYEANVIVNAYNHIARGRNYEQCSPLPLATDQIISYLELNDAPCELHIFVDCIFAIDDIFIDKARERQKQQTRQNRPKR